MSTASLLLGAHVSTAGGVPEAPPRALAIEATALQLFTKMANRWAERDCENDECRLIRERLAETRVGLMRDSARVESLEARPQSSFALRGLAIARGWSLPAYRD